MEDKKTRQHKTNNYKRAVTYLHTQTYETIKKEAQNNNQSISQVLANIIEGNHDNK